MPDDKCCMPECENTAQYGHTICDDCRARIEKMRDDPVILAECIMRAVKGLVENT